MQSSVPTSISNDSQFLNISPAENSQRAIFDPDLTSFSYQPCFMAF